MEFHAHRNAEGQTEIRWFKATANARVFERHTFLAAAIQICQISRGDVRESKN